MIFEAENSDTPRITDIYNHYIRNTLITFEEKEIDPAEMSDRIFKVQSAGYRWLVAKDCGKVAGYCYASRWQERSAYKNTVIISIYIHPDHIGKGIGFRLYDELFSKIKEAGFHAIIAGIALPNEASVALHEKFGMKQVARFEEVGYKFGQWVDVGYWQVCLNK